MSDDEPFARDLTARLRDEHGCHTIILYGSRARGDAGPGSDWDLIGFRGGDAPMARDTGLWRGERMDIFVYPDSRMEQPNADLLHIRGGLVLLERDGCGHGLLTALEALHARGPEPLAADEIAARRAWAWKTLDRAARGDVEGDYRRAWLLTMLVENHFLLRGQWYPGSKMAFAALEADDPRTFRLFREALAPSASLAAIAALVEAVNGPRS